MFTSLLGQSLSGHIRNTSYDALVVIVLSNGHGALCSIAIKVLGYRI